MKGSKGQLNEYEVRGEEIDQLIDNRYVKSQQRAEWDYYSQVKQVPSKNKLSYQKVQPTPKIKFQDDMKHLIFDPKIFAEDNAIFGQNSDWKLTAFQQQQFTLPSGIPSLSYIKKRGGNIPRQVQQSWGQVAVQGRISVKMTQNTSFQTKFFNLRTRCLLLYNFAQQTQDRQNLLIPFTQTTFNSLSQTDQTFNLKFGQRILKIKKQNSSKQYLESIQRALMIISFRGSFALRNQAPSYAVQDYITKQVDSLRGIQFQHEQKIQSVASSRYYRQSVAGFFYLLNKESFKKRTLSAEIAVPRWLRNTSIPVCQLGLSCNVVPPRNPLLSLKIKVHESQIGTLNESLKYIFPFKKQYVKRTLIVYDSGLNDEQIGYLVNQVSYPMHTLGFPKNHISILGLQHVLNAANNIFHWQLFIIQRKINKIEQINIFMHHSCEDA